MKSSFREHGFAGQGRLAEASRNLKRPGMMFVATIGKCDEKAGVGNSSHKRANPFRCDRSGGPSTEPARRMNLFVCASARRSCSSCSRMICPCGMPVRRDFSSSQAATDFGSRTVIVLLMWQKCIQWRYRVNARRVQYDFAQITRCGLRSPVKMQVPGSGASANGMHRIVTFRSAFTCSSASREPFQCASANPP
jgi:hypothetical protein